MTEPKLAAEVGKAILAILKSGSTPENQAIALRVYRDICLGKDATDYVILDDKEEPHVPAR